VVVIVFSKLEQCPVRLVARTPALSRRYHGLQNPPTGRHFNISSGSASKIINMQINVVSVRLGA